jgi:peptidoglycan/LPS O-acetylase OafA/YrhL
VVTAASVAIAAVAIVSSALLLDYVTSTLDEIGGRCLVFFVGGALLLAARSYRHVAARALLRIGGLGSWSWLAYDMFREYDGVWVGVLWAAAIAVAALLVVVAVATGRGWRSAWWARRAEVAESLCGAAALASVFVAVGLFARVWELTSNVAK